MADGIMEGGYDAEYAASKIIFTSPVKKAYVESCMLASTDLVEISEMLEIPVQNLHIYREIFFDVSRLNKLDKLELIEQSTSDDEKIMKMWALSQGLAFIKWRLGRMVTISPVEGLKDLFATCTFKAKEAMFSGNASEASKQAVNWVKLSMEFAKLLKAWTTDANAARSDIEMALKTIAPDFEGFDSLDKEE